MKAIKVSWRAVFRQPIGVLNPLGAKLPGPFPVEIFGGGEKWQAREIASSKRVVYTKLPKFASVSNGKVTVAACFYQQVEPWSMWGSPLPISEWHDKNQNPAAERVLLATEVKDLGDGKYGWYTSEDFTHILHAPTMQPGSGMPPAACGAKVPANCFVNNKLNIAPSCLGCLEVWEREYQNA